MATKQNTNAKIRTGWATPRDHSLLTKAISSDLKPATLKFAPHGTCINDLNDLKYCELDWR